MSVFKHKKCKVKTLDLFLKPTTQKTDIDPIYIYIYINMKEYEYRFQIHILNALLLDK